MPNPDFVPLIGSGFDQLGQQRLAWSGFNRGVEESNLDRAAQAQRTQNAYLAQIAQMQQTDADRQAAQQAQAAKAASEQQAAAEDARRFGIQTELSKQGLGIKQLEAQNKRMHWNFNLAEKNKAEKKALDLAENFGKARSSEVNDLGQSLDEAIKNLTDSKTSLDQSIAEIQSKNPGIRYDNRQKQFVWSGQGKQPADSVIAAANTEFSKVKAEADKAAIDHSVAQQAYRDLEKEVGQYGLTIQRRGKKHLIYSPLHDKFFGDTSSGGSETSPGFLPRPGSGMGEFRRMEEESSGAAPYAGFTQSTGTTSAPSQKVIRAHALAIAHPSWTKQQIIDAVNQEMP